MVVTQLIEELKALETISKPLFASIQVDFEQKLYIDLFGNSDGLPGIFTSEEEPLPSNKQGNVLLKELQRWRKDSIHYDPKSDVYLINTYQYEDGSYDFRSFRLKAVCDQGDHFILVAGPDESIELREHYEAFDESMLAED